MFDVNDFLTAPIEGATSTEYELVPDDEYAMVVSKLAGRETKNSQKLVEIFWRIDAPGNELAHEKLVKQTIWLDLNEAGNLDFGKGKNVQLGRLRAAVNQNEPGSVWNFAMLEGQPAMGLVENDGKYNSVRSIRSM